MITSFQQGRWTRFLLLLASLILFAVCGCEGLVPQDPSMIAYENGLPAPHVLQIQPNYCVPANIVSHIMYYQTWCMWDQNQIFQMAGGIPGFGLNLIQARDFLRNYPGLWYDTMAFQWNKWPAAVKGTLQQNGIIMSPITSSHMGTIIACTYDGRTGALKSFIEMDPAIRGGEGDWHGCFVMIDLATAINWFPTPGGNVHGICLSSRIWYPPDPPPPSSEHQEEFAGGTLHRDRPWEVVDNLPAPDIPCHECPPPDSSLKQRLFSKARSILFEQDTVFGRIALQYMTQEEIASIRAGELFNVTSMSEVLTAHQDYNPATYGFPRPLANRGLKSYAEAADSGASGVDAWQPAPYVVLTFICGPEPGEEFGCALFEPVSYGFHGFSYYPAALLSGSSSAKQAPTNADWQAARAYIVQKWLQRLQNSSPASSLPPKNMLSAAAFRQQGYTTYMFFEWGVPDALPFYPYIEVTDGDYNVVAIFDRFGMEYSRNENGILNRVGRYSEDWDQSTGSNSIPHEFELSQNYPNPFNSSTSISFTLAQPGQANIVIYDVLGRKVGELAADHFAEGGHTVIWDGRNDQGEPVASGIYFYRLTAGSFTVTRKMVLMK